MPPASRWVSALAAAALIALYAALAVSGLGSMSATFDESSHLPAGYSYWKTGDFRLNPEHPPLVKLLAAAPLLPLQPQMKTDGDEAWRLRRQWEFGRRFLYRWNDADTLLFRARLPMIGLGALLCAAVFLWSRRYGLAPALLALALVALSPDVIAHGRLVATDVPIALCVFLAVIAWDALLRRPGWRRTLLAGTALGVALAVKFSALMLGPIFVTLAAIRVWWRPEPPTTPRSAFACGAGTAIVALAVVWASYGFQARISPDAAARDALEWHNVQPANPLVGAALMAADRTRLLPEAWVFGCLRFLRHSEARTAFLHGALSADGFWYYFPVAFLVKTPLPLLALLAMGAVVAWHRRADLAAEAVLLVPIVFYAGAVVTSGLNIGHRHLLPIYPFLFVLAGRSAAGAPLRSLRGVTIIALLLWYAAGTLRVHPYQLAYFNELAGGPRNGHRWLVDSSLDWGQDLKRLALWQRANGVARLKLSYFGSADPGYHGIVGDLLPGQMNPPPPSVVRRVDPGDVVAVSATNLQGVYLEPGDRGLMDLLRQRHPIAVIGHSIFVYRADFSWQGD